MATGTQVTCVFSGELMCRALHCGPEKIPQEWRGKRNAAEAERLRCVFAPASMVPVMEELLLENNVEVGFDPLAVGAALPCDARNGAEVGSFRERRIQDFRFAWAM